MASRIKYIVLCVIVWSLYSCKREVEHSQPYEVINVKDAPFIDVDIPRKTIDVVALETNENSLVQSITSVFLTDKYIIVFDIGAQRLLKFDRCGKFLQNMSRRGRGPNELIEIRKVVLYNNLLFLYGLGQKMIVMDLDGNVVRNIKFDDGDFISFSPNFDGGLWTYMYSNNKGNRSHYLTLLDKNTKVINRWGEKHPRSLNIVSPQIYFFEDGQGNNYFRHHLTDYIYILDNNKTQPIYKFDVGDNTPDYENIATLWKDEDIDFALEGKTTIGDVVFVGHHLIFTYSRRSKNGSKRHYGIYDTREKETYISNQAIDFSFYLNTVNQDGTYFYRIIQPHLLKGEILKEYEKRCGHQLNEDDNPIIVIDKVSEIKLLNNIK